MGMLWYLIRENHSEEETCDELCKLNLLDLQW